MSDKKRTKAPPEKRITITFQESYNTQLYNIGLCYVQQGKGSKKIAGSFNMGTDEWDLFKEAMETVDHPSVTVVLEERPTKTVFDQKEKVEL